MALVELPAESGDVGVYGGAYSGATAPDARPLAPHLNPHDEASLVNHVLNLLYQAKNARRPLLQTWYDSYEVLHNRTWAPNQMSWMPHPEVSEIFPILDAIIGWMTDQNPQFASTPAAEPFSPYWSFYEQLASDLNTVLNSTWQIENYDTEIEQVLWDAFTYRTGFFKAVWDPSLHMGLGNAIMRRVDPFTLYIDPKAKFLRDAMYIQEARTMAAQELERRWPGALAKIGEGNWYTYDHDITPDALNDTTTPRAPMANPGAISPATAPSWGLPGQTDRLSVTDDPGITVIESWLRVPVKVTDDGKTRYFDSWRCVVIAGNRVLVDKPATEIYSHGTHPYDEFSLAETGELFPFSYVELLAPIQRSVNEILSAIQNNLNLMGNPVFLEDVRAGIARATITNQPGQRVKINPGGRAEWLDPPQPHPQMSMQFVEFLINEMERISGLSAMVRGATPSGRNAQGVIDSVQEAAFVRIRKMLRGLNRTLRRQGDKLGCMIAEFYDTPRIVAITGPSGEKSALTLHASHFYVPSPQGRIPLRFQILMSADSNLPTSRQARAAEGDTLFAMGAIDEEAVLDAHDWPGRMQITQRVREMKAQAGTLGQPPGSRKRG